MRGELTILAARLIEHAHNERYKSRNLGKPPWDVLPDDQREKWIQAMQRALEKEGNER